MQGMSAGAALTIVMSGGGGTAGCTAALVLGWLWRGLGRQGKQVVEAAREVAFEAAKCSLLALAFGFLACQVGLGGRVVAGAGDGDDVQGVVELAVAAAVEPVAVVLPRRSRGSAPCRSGGRSWRRLGIVDARRCGRSVALRSARRSRSRRVAGDGVPRPGRAARARAHPLGASAAQLGDLLARDPDAGAGGQPTQPSINSSQLPAAGASAPRPERAGPPARDRARADASATGSARGCAW